MEGEKRKGILFIENFFHVPVKYRWKTKPGDVILFIVTTFQKKGEAVYVAGERKPVPIQ